MVINTPLGQLSSSGLLPFSTSAFQARYTPATELNSTRSTFVESRQSRPRGFGPVHTGDEVDRIGNKVDRDKLSNSRRCRFVAGFGNIRLSTKSTVMNSTVSPVCTGL